MTWGRGLGKRNWEGTCMPEGGTKGLGCDLGQRIGVQDLGMDMGAREEHRVWVMCGRGGKGLGCQRQALAGRLTCLTPWLQGHVVSEPVDNRQLPLARNCPMGLCWGREQHTNPFLPAPGSQLFKQPCNGRLYQHHAGSRQGVPRLAEGILLRMWLAEGILLRFAVTEGWAPSPAALTLAAACAPDVSPSVTNR